MLLPLLLGQGVAGPANYTLTCSAGSYAASGVALIILRKRVLTASAGSYALTPRSSIINRGRKLTATAGSYALTAVTANLVKGRVLTATAGAYSLAGVDAVITYVPSIAGYTLTAQTGIYSLSGVGAIISRGRSLTASPGAYSQAGVSAGLLRSKLITASTGSYPLTGQSATITKSGGVLNDYTLTCSAGSYSLGDYWQDGYVEPGYIGSANITVRRSSAEVNLKRWYVKRKNQLHIFNNADEADAFIEAADQAEDIAAAKTSRRARKRARTHVYTESDVAPVETVQMDWLAAMVNRFAMPVDLPNLIELQAWERVMEIRVLAMEMQDEDDIETLLLMG